VPSLKLDVNACLCGQHTVFDKWLNTHPCASAGPQAENSSLAEALARRKAEVTVLAQKRARVEAALEQQGKQTKALKVAAQRLQVRVCVCACMAWVCVCVCNTSMCCGAWQCCCLCRARSSDMRCAPHHHTDTRATWGASTASSRSTPTSSPCLRRSTCSWR
jgi:hypothetical protein